MPSVLGKRKRALKVESEVVRHEKRAAEILRSVEKELDVERAVKSKEIAATEARVAWAKAVSSVIEQEHVVFPGTSQTAEDAAVLSYWSIGSAYYSWRRPPPSARQSPVPASNKARPSEETSLRSTPAISSQIYSQFRPVSPEALQSMQELLSKGQRPLLVRYAPLPDIEPLLLLLTCPVCSRSDLSNVQGFFNHCRLAHHVTYGGHAECIEACGQRVSESNITSVGLEDIELKGMGVLNVHKLFQRAVGVDRPFSEHTPTSVDSPNVGPDDPAAVSTSREEPVRTHLNATLGLHEETPALASFLGKAAQRRQIKVAEAEIEIEIMAEPNQSTPGTRPLSVVKCGKLDESDTESDLSFPNGRAPLETLLPGPTMPLPPPPSEDVERMERISRFYILRRVTITDRSRYIPASRRDPTLGTDTHGWSLSVTSPSYMPPASTFLREVVIVLPADSNGHTKTFVFSEPPFIASGTAGSPFLARVVLYWAGHQNKETVTDHWVELDDVRSGGWVPGDQQILDIELDKDTVFLSNIDLPHIIKEGDRQTKITDEPMDTGAESSHAETSITQLLERLLPNFPMTMQDTNAGRVAVPYSLVSSAKKLAMIPVGRRRFIQWQRARSLRFAAEAELALRYGAQSFFTLTTGSLLHWLDALWKNVHKPRIAPQSLKRRSRTTSRAAPQAELFCAICGVPSDADVSECVSCHGVERLSEQVYPTDLSRSLTQRTSSLWSDSCDAAAISGLGPSQDQPPLHAILGHSSRIIIQSVHPDLALGILNSLQPLQLCSVPRMDHAAMYPLDRFGTSSDEVEQFLEPFAVLALIARAFIRRLTVRAFEQSEILRSSEKVFAVVNGTFESHSVKQEVSDLAAVLPTNIHCRPVRTKQRTALTPVHILRGLLAAKSNDLSQDGFDMITLRGLGTVHGRALSHIKLEDMG